MTSQCELRLPVKCRFALRRIAVKADYQDRELIVHELIHVLQYERFGGIEGFLKAYMPEILPPQRYEEGPLEEEATNVARRICRG
jgi:hypothetical protein